jgi:hypothetical protein
MAATFPRSLSFMPQHAKSLLPFAVHLLLEPGLRFRLSDDWSDAMSS